ncbi:MAG: translocation protein TolB [Epsilonproteobacteria bacterium (ex Lamellibrachia satsuma)]|nr:MAG: translocation protein TolB [Epsilonproteobacteria bacterium (ex Lamellibrachia satsuma)]
MKYILLLLLSINLFAVDATLKIEKDVEQRSHIALVDGSAVPNDQISNILLSDLRISGHFLPDSTVYKGNISSNFIAPALKKQEYVLKYIFSQKSGTKLLIRLLKASDGTQILKKSYAIPSTRKMPFLAHKAVSDINNILKYPDISWINRYVVFSRYTTPGHSEILLADYTFNYQKVIIRGGLNLFPKWADKNQKSFYYTSYKGQIPTLYKINIYTGAKEKIISSEGMLVCSDVSKNGSKLLLTMAPGGQADIYEFDLATKRKTRITRFRGIDVNGRYADDESRIVFVSNRLGYANIFKKSIHSAAVSQVVYHGRNNNACDAYGKKIVYSSRESAHTFGNNTFNLYLTSLTGSAGTRPLTTTGSNQFPRFSPDGSVILFIKHRGDGSSIGYINLGSHQSMLFPLGGRKIQSIDW